MRISKRTRVAIWLIRLCIIGVSSFTLSGGQIASGSSASNTQVNADGSTLIWANTHATVPIFISYINDASINNNYNITPMLESAVYEAWVGALHLLNVEIAELERDNGVETQLELKSILLVEKKRLEIDAGGQLHSGKVHNGKNLFDEDIELDEEGADPSLSETQSDDDQLQSPYEESKPEVDKFNPPLTPGKQPTAGLYVPPGQFSPSPLTVTNQKGVNIKLFLDGSTSEFSTLVKFVDKRTGRRIEVPLSKNFSYWKMGLGTDSNANLDAASIVSMFLKLPPMVAEGLGSFLQRIGTLNFFLKLRSTQHWVNFSADEVEVNGLGKVSKFSHLIAKDIFAKICQKMGFTSHECGTKIHKWGVNPITEQIKSYAVMPIVGCTKQFRAENTIPLYHHYVVIPKVKDENIDFFTLDPNRETLMLNLYRRTSDTVWTQKKGMIGSRYGSFLQEVDKGFCRLDEQVNDKRCAEIKFGAHFYERTCNLLEQGYKKDLAYSFYSNKQIIIQPN